MLHPFFSRARELGRPLVLGHRGASAHVTENTLEAFIAARRAGADGVELDVQLCATGEVVIFHDADLSRLAGRGERITTVPWDQLRRVTVGRNARIPTLDQFFDEFRDPEFSINIEVKSPMLGRAGSLVDRVLACIRQHRTTPDELRHVLISSFDPFVIGRVRRLAPDLATGFLFHEGEPRVLRRAWRAPPLKPHALHVDRHLITAERMAAWTAAGFSVAAWTVDKPQDIKRLAAMGVYALISNDPEHTLETLMVSSPGP